MKRKDKDVEALWEEVKRLTLEMGSLQRQYDEQTACVIVHRGSMLACSDAMRAAYYDERRRVEQLVEALEDLVSLAEAAMREGGEYDIEAELADARAAIAKATGGVNE